MNAKKARLEEKDNGYRVTALVDGFEIEIATFFQREVDNHYLLTKKLIPGVGFLHLHSDEKREGATKYCGQQKEGGHFSEWTEEKR